MGSGSIWRIWDFHLHTPFSILNNQYGDTNEDETWDHFIEAIETKSSAANIAAIGITDYFSIEGYKRVQGYQQAGRLRGLLIFPNIEFRVDTLIEKRRLNVHVLFSPEVTATHIEDHFLHDLNFVHENDPFQGPHTRKLRLSNLEEFGATLREQHPPFRNRTSLEIGCMNAKVKLEEIKERLEEDGRFSGKYLLVLADENLGLLNWDGQDHATRKQLLQMSHAVFSSNTGTRDFCLGKHHKSEQEFIAEFKSLKPCIWGCDSHGLKERFLEPDGKRYCWIKGDVTWEGLKQILYEPEARVRIQATNPEPVKSYFTIESVKIDRTEVNGNLCIEGFETALNGSLVVIIGGRGSGKTALLDLVACSFTEGKKLSDLDNSFYSRLYSGKVRAGNANSLPVPISVRFRSGDLFSKLVGQDEKVFEQANILYLTQNHMDDYTANPTKLYDHIVSLVFNMRPDERRGYDALLKQTEVQFQSIQALNLEIEQLHGQVEGRLDKEIRDRAQKEGELLDYQRRLDEQKAQLNNTSHETTKLTDDLRSLKLRRNQMVVLRESLLGLSGRIETFHDQYISDVKQITTQTLALMSQDTLSLTALPEELSQLNEVSGSLTSSIEVLTSAESSIEAQVLEIEQALRQLAGADQVIAQLHRTIDQIVDDINAINQRAAELKSKETRILRLEWDRKTTYVELMKRTSDQRLYLQKAIEAFEAEQDVLLTGLTFAARVETVSRDSYIGQLMEKLDGRRHTMESVSLELNQKINQAERLLNSAGDFETISESALLSFVEDLCTWGQDVRLRSAVTKSHFFNALLKPFFHIGLQIEFNGRPLEALSMGERAVVLLKILLGLDDRPLFIDQPEEHLDNRYIYSELTPAFRNAKTKRQIIIATHNANLVVNTDAEQIIVADNSNGVLSYRVGTLEDLTLRDSITTILEGGNQAFKKREERYGYRF